jgi:hypothetical protein
MARSCSAFGYIAVTGGMKLAAQSQRTALHLFGGGVVAQILINIPDPFAEIRFDVGLIGQLGADAGGGLVQNFFQERRIAAFGDFRAGACEHLFKEARDLRGFGGFGLGLLTQLDFSPHRCFGALALLVDAEDGDGGTDDYDYE